MVGYWKNPAATKATTQDGWLDTGDLMKADADGYLWFCGRKKQIIVHDGSNICPQEVEEALLEHVALESAGVVGVHDLVHGENVRAHVALKAGATRPTAQELIQFARARVGYKAPDEIIVLAAMPLNPTGKVDRTRLKKWAAEQTHPTIGTPIAPFVMERLLDQAARRLDIDPVDIRRRNLIRREEFPYRAITGSNLMFAASYDDAWRPSS